MLKSRIQVVFLKIIYLILVFFLATPALAATVRLPSGERVEISSEQVEQLKKQPGIYMIKHPPAGGLRHVILIPLPKELGDGFLLGTPKDVSAALDAVGVTGTDRQRVTGTFSGEIGVTGRITDGEDDSAQAQEYRDLETPVYGDLEVKYEKKNQYFLEVTGKNIGRDDQHYRAAGGRYGKFKIEASYDELTHRFAEDAESIYSGNGNDNLGLRGPAQDVPFADRANRLNALSANAKSVDIELERKKVEVSAEVAAYDPLNFRVEFGREHKDGTRPFFGSFGLDNTVEITEPIDYDTTEVKFIGEYAKKPLYFNLSYYFSLFENNTDTLTWDNPFRATDTVGAAAQGLIDLAPDNHYHNVSASGSYMNNPLKTRISATASWGWMIQDDDLVPYTTNTALTTPTGGDASDPNTLPEKSVDAEVNTYLYHVLLTSSPVKLLHLKGKFRYFEYDNNTDQIKFPGFVPADDFFVTPDAPGATSIVNLPTSYKKTTAGGNLGFDLYEKTRLNLGYTFEQTKRTNREVDKQDDQIFAGSIDSSLFSRLDLRASYERTERDIDDYDFEVYLESGQDLEQLLGLRKYDQADMTRDRFGVQATVYPWEPVALSTSFTYGEDDFDDSPYGLLEDKHYIFTFEADYHVSDRLNLHGFYSYEYYKNRQKDFGEVPSAPVVDADWFSRSRDIVNTVGARVQAGLIPDKLDLDISYSFSDVDGRIDFYTPAANTDDFNTVDETTIHILETKLNYTAWKPLVFTLGYMYENFDYEDYNKDGFTNVPTDSGGASNGAYLMGTLPEDYEVNVVYLRVSYRF
jgi:MtrB/PioB family decaheme-associated outer membrane protein